MNAVTKATGSALSAVGLGSQQEESDLKMFEDQCKMSRTNRMIAFSVCFGLGFLISILSFWSIMKPVSFALLFSFGNIISLMSTGFLIGFIKQIKNMCDSKRMVSSIIFITSLILTLVCALAIPNKQCKSGRSEGLYRTIFIFI